MGLGDISVEVRGPSVFMLGLHVDVMDGFDYALSATRPGYVAVITI